MLQISLEDEFKILGCAMNRQRKTYDAVAEKNAVSKQRLLEEHYDTQEQRCSMEGKMSMSGGPCVCRLCLWE